MFAVLFGSVVIGLGIILLLTKLQRKHHSRLGLASLPGPKGWPIIGSALDISRSNLPPHQTIARWTEQFGPVFTVQMPNANWIVLSDFAGIHDVLVTKAHEAGARLPSFRNQIISRGLRGILISNTDAPWWLAQRKAFHRSTKLYGDSLERIEGIFSDITEHLTRKFSEYSERDVAVDVREDLYDFTTKAIYIILTGKKPSSSDEKIRKSKIIEHSIINAAGPNNVQGTLLDAFPILRYLGNPAYKKLQRAAELCDSLWDELWRDAQATYVTDDSECLIHSLAQLMDPQSKFYNSSVTIDNMKAVYADIIMAGLATTTSSLYGLFNILLHHPSVQLRLQQEVDTVVGRSRCPRLADRDKMPYTTATILETLRYMSITPTLGHITREDVDIVGHRVPAGTICVCVTWTLHHSEKIFGDPWEFRPERYLDNSGSLLPAEHPVRKNTFTFGGGPRVCVGEVFALRRMFYVISHVMQAFQLVPEDPESMTSCDPRSYAYSWVLEPNDFKIRFKERL